MASFSRKAPPAAGVFKAPAGDIKEPEALHVKAITAITLVLMTVGLINLYSASFGAPFFNSQIKNLGFVVVAFILVGWVMPLRYVRDYAYWIFGVVCLMLIIVLGIGRVAGGAQRWISLGPFSFQPSEFAKLAIAVVTARYLSSHRTQGAYTIGDLWPLVALVGFAFVLIFLQPDFGTAGLCLLVAFVQLCFVRIDRKTVLSVLGLAPVMGIIGWTMLLRPYQKLRILNLLNPELDPQNTGYHSLQSLIAVGSGGNFGKGFMQGTQTQLKFLPERHTDFIFSVFAEEHGFLGGMIIFTLFSLLTYFALDIARNSRDNFTSLLSIGVAALLFWEFTINIAMVLGMFPVVGVPLPFFSYGSSLLLTICVGLGLLISISRNMSRRSR